ncbi:protoporphyrinogen oxidase [Solibacillus sp. FSL W8-0372]|uniref:protoporphyrinogen oxidase n=1 Tax=Solibacillus sp. FSL W8-0372 TaxID=2921713 RepID=UPI0030D479D8
MMKVTLKKRKVVIVGGGITGLTTAYYLQQKTKAHNLPIDIVLIEASLRLGGKIHTERKDGYIIERGPESFFDTGSSVRKLARDLNIEHEIVQNNNGRTFIAVGSKLHQIPSNILLGGSPKIFTFMTSNVLSLMGKFRAAGDLFLPKLPHEADEAISEFFSRRFGKELVENLVEPVLAGTFAGDVDHVSMQSMFPQFYQLENDYRSLLVGMKKTGKGIYALVDTPGEIHYESFVNGLESLIETLENSLTDVTILKGLKVNCIENNIDYSQSITLNDGTTIDADKVVMTTPFNVTKKIFPDSDIMQQVPEMNYATIATVTMAFKPGTTKKYEGALNFFVSRNSHFAITSCTWSHQKWDNITPDGHELIRVYIGRVGDESIVELSDNEIEKIVLQDLNRAVGLDAQPLFTTVARWKEAMPQYTIGHQLRMTSMKEQFYKEFPNVYLAGSSYEGISIPDCILQGRETAELLLAQLLEQKLAI